MNTSPLAATGTPADALAQSDSAILLGTTKQASSSTHTKINNLPEETFSSLLAQQIQDAGILARSISPVAIDTAAASASDKKTLQNKPEISSETNIVNDPTDAVAAIMLQLQIPTNNVYVKDTPQDKGTALSGEISTNSVNSSGYSTKRDDGGFNPRVEGYLKSTVADPLSSNNHSSSPFIQREPTDTVGLHQPALPQQPTLTQQPEKPSTRITLDLSVAKNPLFTGEAIQNAKESKEVSTKKTGSFTKVDALNQTDTTTSISLEKPQNESPLPVIAADPQRNEETNTGGSVHAKDGLNSAPINITSFSSGALQSNTAHYLSTDLTQTINSPLGADKWSNEFSQKVVWMCTQQNQIAELHLNPADLGPLNVTLKIANDQLTAQFISPHSAVREAIESAMPKLREILADNGILLNNASVSDQSPRDQGTGGYTNQDSRTTKQAEISVSTDNAMAPTNAKALPSPTRRHDGILDTFA